MGGHPNLALAAIRCEAFVCGGLVRRDNGPSSTSPSRPSFFMEFTCRICGIKILTWDVLPLLLHFRACVRSIMPPEGDEETDPPNQDDDDDADNGGGEPVVPYKSTCGDNTSPSPGPQPTPMQPSDQWWKPAKHHRVNMGRRYPLPRTGRGDAILTCGDVESNPGPPVSPGCSARPFACPIPDCRWAPVGNRIALVNHLNSIHFPAGQFPSAEWMDGMELWFCRKCESVQGLSSACPKFHRPQQDPPPMPTTPLTTSEPLSSPTLQDILSLRRPTMRHIPQGARAACGKSLGLLLRAVVTQQSWESLQRLFLFPKLVLQNPPRWGKRHRTANTKRIVDHCRAILERPLAELWTEMQAERPEPRPSRKRFTVNRDPGGRDMYDELLEAQVQALLSEGALGKAAKHLTSDGVHGADSLGIWETLQQLHPKPPTPIVVPPHNSEEDTLFEEEGERKNAIRKAILQFPAGSACGPSGLRPRHLQDILQGDQGGIAALLQGLNLLTEACESGVLPAAAATWLCCATLIPLKKPTGNNVRPVAVGETLRRTIEKVLSSHQCTRTASESLQPRQVGQGKPGACELLGRSLQQCLESESLPADWGSLQVDLSNAFNSVDRTAVLAGVKKWAPHLLPWAILSLQQPAPLFSPLGRLESAQGVQQGSPLGPLFFNLAIQDIILSCPGDLDWNVWYLDDGTLLGRQEELEKALRFLEESFRKIGLMVNLSKCSLWGPITTPGKQIDPELALHHVRQIPWKCGSGTLLLGVPVHFPRDPTFATAHFRAVLAKVKQSCNILLTRIRDPQTQLQLLRGCFSACKFTFLLRSTQGALYKDVLQEADKVLRATFEGILGCEITDAQWIQTTLQYQEGGLGVESPLIQGAAASMAGFASWIKDGQDLRPRHAPIDGLHGLVDTMTWLRGQIGTETEPLKTWCAQGSLVDVEPEHTDQKHWSSLIHQRRKEGLLQNSGARDTIRLKCQTSASAGAWSRAPPCAALGCKIGGEAYRLMLRWHLGVAILPQVAAGKPCPACGEACDIFGDHAVCCRRNNLWRRHFLLQDFMLRLSRAAGFQATREKGLGMDSKREADILIQNWRSTQSVAIDLTVRHPRAPGLAFTDPEKTLTRAEEEKRAGANERAAAGDVLFEPLVFHTWSGVPSTGTSKKFLAEWLTKVTENRPGLDKERKRNEIQEGLSCILFAQIAEQLQTVLGSNEIPVYPNMKLPNWVDSYGNEVGHMEHHSGNKRLRRTVETVVDTGSSPRPTRKISGAPVNATAQPPAKQLENAPESSSSSSGSGLAASDSSREQVPNVEASHPAPVPNDLFHDPNFPMPLNLLPPIPLHPWITSTFPLPPLSAEDLSQFIPPWGDDAPFPNAPGDQLLADLQNLLTENLSVNLDS